MFFVYIIRSTTSGILYKGFSTNPQKRLIEHNSGESKYTSNKGPWELVYVEKYEMKKEALIRERQLKRYNISYLNKLIELYNKSDG